MFVVTSSSLLVHLRSLFFFTARARIGPLRHLGAAFAKHLRLVILRVNMAEVNKVDDRQIYAFIANIPSFYHSADLRNYFSQFIEQGGFDCFHFRHRPETVRTQQENTVTGTPVCDSNVLQQSAGSLANEGKSSDESSARRGKRLCCVVRLHQSKFVELVRMYHRKCWLDRKGESIRSLCYTSIIKVADDNDGENILRHYCYINLKTGAMYTAGRVYRKWQRRTRPVVNKSENIYTHGRVRLRYFFTT